MTETKPYAKLGGIEADRMRAYRFDRPIHPVSQLDGKPMDPTRDVVVSDAITHVERLVFAVYPSDGGRRWEEVSATVGYDADVNMDNIEGEITLMICGGDPSTVEPDEAYLDRLAEMMEEAPDE